MAWASEYELTAFGQSLIHPFSVVADWAMQNQGTIRAARARYDQRIADA